MSSSICKCVCLCKTCKNILRARLYHVSSAVSLLQCTAARCIRQPSQSVVSQASRRPILRQLTDAYLWWSIVELISLFSFKLCAWSIEMTRQSFTSSHNGRSYRISSGLFMFDRIFHADRDFWRRGTRKCQELNG